jgi:hypothetical protein
VYVPAGADSRITIPLGWCQRIGWASGDDTRKVWLLMLVPGRFRVLSDQQALQDPLLNEVRTLIIDGPPPPQTPATAFDPSDKAALVGRLIPTSFAPGSSWRLIVPKQVVEGDRAKKDYVLLFSLGYLELWFSKTYDEALAGSLDTVI